MTVLINKERSNTIKATDNKEIARQSAKQIMNKLKYRHIDKYYTGWDSSILMQKEKKKKKAEGIILILVRL